VSAWPPACLTTKVGAEKSGLSAVRHPVDGDGSEVAPEAHTSGVLHRWSPSRCVDPLLRLYRCFLLSLTDPYHALGLTTSAPSKSYNTSQYTPVELIMNITASQIRETPLHLSNISLTTLRLKSNGCRRIRHGASSILWTP